MASESSKNNPRYSNGSRRRKLRARLKAIGAPCAICGRPIHYDEPSDSQHPLSFVVDEIHPISRYREFGYKSKAEAALDWNNVQACHYICNQRKSNKTMQELNNRINQFICLPDGRW
jgi:5-methylcytosine-specific restriction endonuclease McrA